MFVRRTQTRSTTNGERYFTHRLVRSERRGSRVRQRTLLNLGSHFSVPQADWPLLCARIDQLLSPQEALPACDIPHAVEREAHRIAAQLVAGQVPLLPESAPQHDAGDGEREFHNVDVASLQLLRPRSVGVEHLGLWAMQQVQFIPLLTQLGLNGPQRAAAVGSIIARMAAPGSERATYSWLCHRSALGELLDTDFEAMSMMQLYRASDALVGRQQEIEQHLFNRMTDLFGLQTTVTLYDLTNTYFEGEAAAQDLAKHGHSKEKRSDCPLLTLALVLDGSGFVRRSEVLAGNVKEQKVLAATLKRLEVPVDALIVMDCGAATEENLKWMRQQGYRYLAVSRERTRRFDADSAQCLRTASGQRPCPVGEQRGSRGPVLLLGGSPSEGAGDGAAGRQALREGIEGPPRGAVAAADAQEAGAYLAADRAPCGRQRGRGAALPDRGAGRCERQEGGRDHVGTTAGGRLEADRSGGVLPAQQSDGLGCADDVAHLHHVDGP